jgi:serine phosphatase RsbU (regulator of sigma subunit)
MKKRKTLKSIIIISFISLVLSTGIFMCIFQTILIYQRLKSDKKNTTKYIEESFKADLELSIKNHHQDIKSMMYDVTKSIANDLTDIIKKEKNVEFNKKLIDKLLGSDVHREHTILNISILNQNGDILFNRREWLINKNYSIFKKTEPQMYSFTKKALATQEAFRVYESNPSSAYKFSYRFTMAIRIPETSYYVFSNHIVDSTTRKLTSELNRKKEKKLKIEINNLEKVFIKTLLTSIIFEFFILLFFIVVTYWIGVKLAHWISNPLVQIQDCVNNYRGGQFHIGIPESGSLETANFVRAFNKLGKKLDGYMHKLEKEIIAKNEIKNEIRIARNIQKSILPHFSNEYDNESFSLYAELVPAKNVAGDFYDYFYLNKEKTKLAFLIGDVSGKGISAAFFMCIVKTFIKSLCLSGSAYNKPQNILEQTNKYICENNDEYMFVTLFLGYYDITTGDFNYANAGHHSTIQLITKNNQIKDFGLLNNAVLGFYAEHEYSTGHINIKHGEKLVLYTDGITEAVSPEQKEYGIEGLNKILSENITASPKNICGTVIENVIKFQKNTLFDDITILVFHRK